MRGHYKTFLCLAVLGFSAGLADAQIPPGFPCQPLVCSSLLPARSLDDPETNDCAYRAGNLWWVDYVAGSLAWNASERSKPITVAIFDDGAWVDH